MKFRILDFALNSAENEVLSVFWCVLSWTPIHMFFLFRHEGFRERIVSGKVKFADLASVESDCSSAKNGGDLGPFGRGKMQSK